MYPWGGSVFSLVTAWILSTTFFMLAPQIKHLLKDKGLIACERLMGFLLTLISVEMFLEGLKLFFNHLKLG